MKPSQVDDLFKFASVPVVRDARASSMPCGENPNKKQLDMLVEELVQDVEANIVISYIVKHANVVNHATTRGRNDLGWATRSSP